ncbi:cytochrome c oxidase subunit V [Cutaneotrichosporon oleaginosum]|uniref:Cytochrome c oxidase subunit V n=1 Tax=Cutaneotrichosporon oleaginosum TaxID=879819 RepID=A0A0J0XM30_9TREE|nr:cytochrome c oxidase subunit V [Cutaneotrichosporon oleaginosum]KLT42171.1 cytochrome c oxidase subunit V [Cutaneotrichosporon oleaginosum]TXT11706.1 hypothetical protein COLE_02116 [Cutaneotrichosporon oleaginosum]
MSLLRIAASRAAAPRLMTRAASSSVHVVSQSTNASAPLLANIEASWSSLPASEQAEVYQALEEVQKKDWKELTVDEKKAAYFVSFGPHGPRAPVLPPGGSMKVFAGTLAAVAAAFTIFAVVRSQAPPPPKTWNREYQEQSNEYLKEQKSNPISGVSSEGYKGKGMVMV